MTPNTPDSDSKFIPGIFNYCDRCCERCPKTSRCRVYADLATEDAADRIGLSRDPANEAFWNRISKNFARTQDMLTEYMEREGIEITKADLEEAGRHEDALSDRVDAHPLAQAGHDYGMAVHDWFESDPAEAQIPSPRQTLARLTSRSDVGWVDLPGDDPEAAAAALNDALEVIQWYHFQIGVKTKRALHGNLDDEEEDADDPEFPPEFTRRRRADGSARVALIGTDRSLSAWTILRDQIQERASTEDADQSSEEIFNLMIQLDQIRRGLEQLFPKARGFRRPGFDD